MMGGLSRNQQFLQLFCFFKTGQHPESRRLAVRRAALTEPDL
jgi:hypothetical protein